MTVNNELAEAAESATTDEQANSFEWTRVPGSDAELVCDLCPDHQVCEIEISFSLYT